MNLETQDLGEVTETRTEYASGHKLIGSWEVSE